MGTGDGRRAARSRDARSPTARGRSRSVELRREEILTATLEQVDRSGLSHTRVADVAQRLGVSSGLVFYHFGTKSALLAEAFQHAVDRDLRRLHARARRGADPVERLRQVVRRYGSSGFVDGSRLWIDAWAAAQREREIQAVLQDLDRRWGAVFVEVVEDGVHQGVFTCADPPASVARISALLDGLSVAAHVYRSVTRAQLRRWVVEAVAAEVGVPPERLR